MTDAIAPSGTFFTLIRRLADGTPIPTDEAAQLLGCVAEDVDAHLRALPARVERDEHGRIVGAGLTLVPTEHRFEVEGRTLYVWCALDALFFPVALGREARVESRCGATGAPVRLVVGPSGVSDLEPPEAVVTLVAPDPGADIRQSFCVKVKFYASTEAARAVAPKDATIVSVVDAYLLARQLVPQLLNGTLPLAGGVDRGAKPSCCEQ